ncbi:transcriptional regulator [Streptomyces sp. HNM0575]|uniref:transcriptional regulator n=1 Tax=Streptomyces sp. HNM0575 TaxID=2716338 RepID=UPI00145F6DC9|nr:transcriptional regulator [Streptomyces sp. HNM0575]NLU74660.1 transcriptional regulator [Streptomyces sp. HNM0575]
MYDITIRRQALALVAQGRSLNSVSRQTGISRAAIRSWQTRLLPVRPGAAECSRCALVPAPPPDAPNYAYLLGLYLGDGCVSRLARTYSLRIACSNSWPGLIEECARAVKRVRPCNKVFRVRAQGCVMVTAYNPHWPCLFPQHGPGRKHERRIRLRNWQQEIADLHPWDLVRGLVHSDGCRIVNWTTRMVAGRRKRYEYPRYFFTNKSGDIRRIYTDALDAVGVEWSTLARDCEPLNISVARRASVALMDAHVGAKY